MSDFKNRAGQLVSQKMRAWFADPTNYQMWREAVRENMAERTFDPRPCQVCGKTYQPIWYNNLRCDGCLSPAAKRQRECQARKRSARHTG